MGPSRKFWFVTGALWVGLNLVMPQASTQTGPERRAHTLHPFFTWHLFNMGVNGETRYSLDAKSCPGSIAAGPHPMDALFSRNGAIVVTFVRRLSAIGRRFEAGDREFALNALNRLVRATFPDFEGCDISVVRVNPGPPARRDPVEGLHVQL